MVAENLLAKGVNTIAYSYIGPEVTWPIYKSGTIGRAKEHLAQTAEKLNQFLQEKLQGRALISVNKAVVTQASSAIPVVPLYNSVLFKVMKEKNLQPRILYPARFSFRFDREIKSFTTKVKRIQQRQTSFKTNAKGTPPGRKHRRRESPTKNKP